MFGIEDPSALLRPWKSLQEFSEELYAMFTRGAPPPGAAAAGRAGPPSPASTPAPRRPASDPGHSSLSLTRRARLEAVRPPATPGPDRRGPAHGTRPRPAQPEPEPSRATPAATAPEPDRTPAAAPALTFTRSATPGSTIEPPRRTPDPVQPATFVHSSASTPTIEPQCRAPVPTPGSRPRRLPALDQTDQPRARPTPAPGPPGRAGRDGADAPHATRSAAIEGATRHRRRWEPGFEALDIGDFAFGPIPAPGGTTVFVGKVTGPGTDGGPECDLYPDGPDGDPMDGGPFEVNIPGINPDETWTPGEWLYGIFQFTDQQGSDSYYAQPPMWRE